MITSAENKVTIGRVMAIGFLLATLLIAMLLSAAPRAGAAVPADSAFAWGGNEDGQLGNDTSGFGTETNTPAAVSNLEGVKSVKAGNSHSLALMNNGTVRSWGYNGEGELGNGTTDPISDVPVRVRNLTDVKAIAAGYSHNLALKEDGSVWAWGYNYYGQLGNGTDGAGADSNVPVKVANLGTGVKAIAAGDDFSLALMQDGTVKSWGYDGDGQLGNGIDTNRNKPGPVSNLANVKAIATDSDADHALALLESGRVKAWGYNGDGQLGNGTSGTDATTPVNVLGLTNVRSIAGGATHSLALLESGKVKAWGNNFSGQVGNDTSGNDVLAPVNVVGLTNVRSIAGGGDHSLAILESGRARSWGDNDSGQLGNGTDGAGTESDVPVAVKNLSNVTNIDGGGYHTLAAT